MVESILMQSIKEELQGSASSAPLMVRAEETHSVVWNFTCAVRCGLKRERRMNGGQDDETFADSSKTVSCRD